MKKVSMTLGAAALLYGTAAGAQMKPAPAAKATVAAKTTTAKTSVAVKTAPAAKPAPAMAKPAPAAVAKPRAKAAPAATGRMVTTKTTTGKTITYNCSLAGNKAKKACQ